MTPLPSPWLRLSIFWALTFLLLGLVPAAQAIFAVPSLDFGAMARAASARTGVPWTSNLFDVLRLALVAPGLWLLVLGSATPTLAAVAALAGARDWHGLRDWCGRFNPARLWRQTSPQSAFAVILVCVGVIACLLATFEIRKLIGLEAYARPENLFGAGLLTALLAAGFLDQGAVLEEGGWRGYATPLLQHAGVAPIHAALAIGVAWGLWHLPRDIVSGVVQRLGFVGYAGLYLPAFLAGTISVSVIAAYCMNRLGGSVFPAIVIHGLTNDAIGLSGAATIDVALTPMHQMTKALPLALVACGIFLVAGSALGRTRASNRSFASGRAVAPIP